ncbi:hypothetical protein [Sphingomonas sp. VDB2]|uniref:hypothetical protein n=1 Tax=Sphingomonas sp. VDB2 TaxID=3228751 RepID=UPI003A804A94
MKKRLTVDELTPVAREATRLALENHEAEFRQYRDNPNLTLGTIIEDDFLTFQLYLAGKTPGDAVVLTSTRVSRISGEVVSIEIKSISSSA